METKLRHLASLVLCATLGAGCAGLPTSPGPTSPPAKPVPQLAKPRGSAPSYGWASYYGDEFHHRPTASGEPYDPDKLTAAHRTHAFGTRLKVTHLGNRRSIVVRVNDRGPYIPGRSIDLSERAAREIGLLDQGVARVSMEVVRD